MWNLLNRLGGQWRQHSSRGAAAAPAARQARLSLEALEDRLLMSTSIVMGQLRIVGTLDRDQITVDRAVNNAGVDEIIVREQSGSGPWVESRRWAGLVSSIQIETGAGIDTITLDRVDKTLAIFAGTESDFVFLHSARALLPAFEIGTSIDGGPGSDWLYVHDQNNLDSAEYFITQDSVEARSAMGERRHDDVTFEVENLVLNAANRNTDIRIHGSPASLTVNAGTGQSMIVVSSDTVNFFPDAELHINGQGGGDTLLINDHFSLTGHTFSVAEGVVAAIGGAYVGYSGVGAVVLRTSDHADVVDLFFSPLATPLTVVANGGGATGDTLRLSDVLPGNWQITGPGEGFLDTTLAFVGIENLTGSAYNRDRFAFTATGSVAAIDGRGGRDTLDYSAFTSPVTVNLGAGTGQGFSSVASVENVFGGTNSDNITGNDAGNVLVGGPGNDTLNGGVGRDLLIGGVGADVLDGGADEDILIGGTTSYDANDAALNTLMTEWTRIGWASGYADRVANLEAGVRGPNWTTVRLVRGTTVFADSSSDSLRGGAGTALDWFFADPARIIRFNGRITGIIMGDWTPDQTNQEIVR